MLTADYAYELPESLIAQEALEPRDSARLLDCTAGLRDRRIYDLPALLQPGDLLVLNRTRVIPARLFGTKESGGRVEVLLLHPWEDAASWRCLIRGRVHVGTSIRLDDGPCVVVRACMADGQRQITFPDATAVLPYCEAAGHVPLPPYIKRPDTRQDRERYQTVFGDRPGSVAAPTASLHLTAGLLDRLASRGIERCTVELRVGPGTFQPVTSAHLEEHLIHAEWCCCDAAAVAAIQACRARGGRVVAVGTTVVRTLESAARQAGGFAPYADWTRLYLHPPQRPAICDLLLTNFHLPRSTLLMLVACFCGREQLLAAYEQAIARAYRFYSYGDAMLVEAKAAG